MIIEHNNKKWFIREDMGTGFYIENGNVFAVPLGVSGLPHDEGARTNVDDFDWSQEDIEKLKRMIRMVLGSHNSDQNGRNAVFTDELIDEDNKNR